MSESFSWKGREVAAKYRRVAATSLNQVAAHCVVTAKDRHQNLPGAPMTKTQAPYVPGWTNRSGQAEGSIQVLEPASEALLSVLWGSRGIVYMKRLEFEHGGALRYSASLEYPKLKAMIVERARGV